MRFRDISLGLGALILLGIGCQNIAGITDLEVGKQPPPPTGGGGSGASGGSSGEGGTSNGGAGGESNGAGGQGGGEGGGAGLGEMCDAMTMPCQPDLICEPVQEECKECGFMPPAPPCNAALAGSICGGVCAMDGGADVCQRDCSAPNCASTITVGSTGAGQALRTVVNCPGSGDCTGLTVQCTGAAECKVICGDGACSGLTLEHVNVGQEPAPLKLECMGPDACSNATLNCGPNACDVVGPGVMNVTQECGPSCDCNPGN
jgi:hypothetical protein